MAEYVVKQGDCISSIAEQHGFFWQTLWEHPRNASLRAQGRDPNALRAGDVVFIPDKRVADYVRATGASHTFRVRGVPAKLRLRFCVAGQPRANEPCAVEVDGRWTHTTTDGDGRLEVSIHPCAVRARVVLGEGASAETHEISLGHVDPVEELSGVQARLNNLGFRCDATGTLDAATVDALRAFQGVAGLAVTGEPDDATRAALCTRHGS
jgi:hypothetical protein